MKYFKVKKEWDNYPRKDGSGLIQNELYTEKEVQRYKIPASAVQQVNEKKNETYWLFGARFGSMGYNNNTNEA